MKELHALVFVLAGMVVGTLSTDRVALRDCARYGEHSLWVGGALTCEVKRETK